MRPTWFGSRAAASRRVVGLLVVATVVLGGIGLDGLAVYSRQRYVGALYAADLTNDLGQLIGIAQVVVAASPVPDAVLARAHAGEAAVRGDLRELERATIEPEELAPMERAVDSYLLRFEQEQVVAQAGDLTLARRLLGDQVAAFNALDRQAHAYGREVREAARAAALTARVGSGLLVAGLLALSGLLLRWRGEQRERADRAAAEQRSLVRFESMVESGSEILVLTDAAGRQSYVSPAIEHVLGYPRAHLIDGQVDLVGAADLPRAVELLSEALRNGHAGPIQCEVAHADGGHRVMEISVDDLTQVPEVAGLLWRSQDVTERARAEHALRDREESFRLLFDRNPHPMAVYDRDSLAFLEVNQAGIEHYGYTRDEFMQMQILDLCEPVDVDALREFLLADASGDGTELRRATPWRHRLKDGARIEVEITSSKLTFAGHRAVLALAEDVTTRLEVERALVHQAMHDHLTDLPNRTLLLDRAEQALARCERDGTRMAIVFIDLDDFKKINDGRGHSAGDQLLIDVAQRLRRAVRPGDTVARIGGDEFVVLLDSIADQQAAESATTRIAWALDRPFTIEAQEVFISASQGIALAEAGEDTERLLGRADAAMYLAKERGRGRAEFADAASHDRAARRLQLESDLHRAIGREEFTLHYQPVIALGTDRIVGAEALIRWAPPGQEPIPPDSFIPIAEQTGLILPIGEWVLRRAMHDAAAWPTTRDGAALTIAINVSTVQLMAPNFPSLVEAALHESGIDSDRVRLEITETMLMHDLDRATVALHALKRLGVHIDIDDFGTGYSSLAYVQGLPVDTLKIDRSFIDRLQDTEADTSIVTAVVNLGRSLGISVLAEGVETAGQRDRLDQLGCEFAQGFLFSRPVPLDQFRALVNAAELDRSVVGAVRHAPSEGRDVDA